MVKYTYIGDANLDGKIDSSDYARLNNGLTNQLTGWGNGDFNYDGVVNGSDYTLLDNTFNKQGAALGFGTKSTFSGPAYYIKLDSSNSPTVDIYPTTTGTGTPTQLTLSSTASISVTATGSTASLTVDFTNGNPIPNSGVSFNGLTGSSNTLKVIAPAGSNVFSVNGSSVTVSSPYSASISYVNTNSIVFTGNGTSDVLNQTAQPGGSLVFANMTVGDTLNVSGGTFSFVTPTGPGITTQTLGQLLVISGATVADPAASNQSNRAVLVLGSLTIGGVTNAWTSKLDLAGNDMVVHNGSIGTITNQIKSGYNLTAGANFAGFGIDSSMAAANTAHLTTLGVVQNSNSGVALYGSSAALGLFDGLTSTVTTDVLVKYTYYGDANLDGKTDGSDYSRIDAAFAADKINPTAATGWFNGDFNYDGVINGSDYTLIDNTFNRQGAKLAAQIAGPDASVTAQIAGTTSVPEPGALGLIGFTAASILLGRRRRCFSAV